ncbi:MAG: DUF222 domain-containing protein [Geodermatophilaceae bacterium]|nr:DUF222 domain-containing protein [Geodermatophilaceae bacterium]
MSLAELPAPESPAAPLSVIDAAREAVAAAYGQPVWRCTDSDLVEEISAALALRAQADAVLLTRLAEAESRDLCKRRGFRSMPAWLRAAHRLAPGEACGLVRTAVGLRDRVAATGAALGAGDISYGQARVIDAAIDTLSKDLPEAALIEGEQILLDQAGAHDPVGLAQIGERLFAILDPVGYQQAQEDKVETGERGAYAERGFTLTPDTIGSGSLIRGSGWVGGDAVIAAALDALAAPRPTDDTGPDLRSAAARRYDALHELCRRSLHAAPTGSGDGGKVQLRVTVPLEVLEHRLTGAGSVLDAGQILSPALARRLACDAQLIPIVLGSASQPLDVGTQQRCFTGARRIAVEERDGGCVMPGCSRPAAWCDVHHLLHWADGGSTAVDNGALACGEHHPLFETGDWRPELINGRIWVRPPPTIDPDRKPRINHLHRPLPLRR